MSKIMGIFSALRKIRAFEKLQLPFLRSMVDFDIIIEIGYAEEQQEPLTLKQLLLMKISSRTTVARRLARLIEQGIVRRRRNPDDQRSSFLAISPSSLKLFGKYGGYLTSVFRIPFLATD
jgi:DNA-binding MarR family transcriptional regulator